MAKANPLQEQVLKAGLVKKSKVAEVAREQNKARHAKGPSGPSEAQLEAERARAEKAERDRALAAERKAQARVAELRAQARQIMTEWGSECIFCLISSDVAIESTRGLLYWRWAR